MIFVLRVISINLIVLGLWGFNSTVEALSVEWEIGNRFRAFDYLADDYAKESSLLFETFAPHAEDRSITEWLARRVSETALKNGRGISPYTSQQAGPWMEDPIHNNPGYDKQFVKMPKHLYVKMRLVPADEAPPGSCQAFIDEEFIAHGSCTSTLTSVALVPREGTLTIRKNGLVIASSGPNEFSPQLKIILGLGDSYGAGEGSPDQPTEWGNSTTAQDQWAADKIVIGDDRRDHIQKWVKSPATWYSNRCNRSFFSWQSMTALRIAQQNPHDIVSFVHLACAGAEIVDGILAPQRLPLGMPRISKCTQLGEHPQRNRPINKKCDIPLSQISAAVDLLCPIPPDLLSLDEIATIRSLLKEISWGKSQLSRIDETALRKCRLSDLIKPDLVLLQVGGNDMGFGPLIAWALLPTDSHDKLIGNFVVGGTRKKLRVVCPIDFRNFGCINGELSAETRIEDLPYRYSALAYVIENVLGVKGEKVVISNYPNPLADSSEQNLLIEDSSKWNLCGHTAHTNTENEWSVARIALPSLLRPWRWQLNLTTTETKKGEADVINKVVITGLNKAVASAASESRWRFVDVSSVMNGAGWCTDSTGDYRGRLLKPNQLGQWNAYSNHVRMIRTSNDSAMTQWPNKRRDDWMSGTFHPNGQGYAAIADKIMDDLRGQ
jgi:hypothetical protein